jgi:hypothetical protein
MRGLLAFSKSDAATFRHCAGATGAEIIKSDFEPSGYIGIHEPMMYPGSLSTFIYTDGVIATELLEAAYPEAINEDGTMKDDLQKYWERFREEDSACLDVHVVKLSLGWFRSCFMGIVNITGGSLNTTTQSELSGQFCLGIAAARKQTEVWDQIQDALDISTEGFSLPFEDTAQATNALLGRRTA